LRRAAIFEKVEHEDHASRLAHTHPFGRLYGAFRGGKARSKKCVHAPSGKPCHGATLAAAVTHIAIQEELDGKVVDWME
jgi:hypothetical protein